MQYLKTINLNMSLPAMTRTGLGWPTRAGVLQALGALKDALVATFAVVGLAIFGLGLVALYNVSAGKLLQDFTWHVQDLLMIVLGW